MYVSTHEFFFLWGVIQNNDPTKKPMMKISKSSFICKCEISSHLINSDAYEGDGMLGGKVLIF